jgi:hypothetical protein
VEDRVGPFGIHFKSAKAFTLALAAPRKGPHYHDEDEDDADDDDNNNNNVEDENNEEYEANMRSNEANSEGRKFNFLSSPTLADFASSQALQVNMWEFHLYTE